MLLLLLVSVVLASANAAPGYPDFSYDAFHAAPIYQPAPVYHSAPILKAAPVYAAAPIVKAAPVIAAPIVKAIPAATSYATVTQVHVAHPQPIVKVAQPIIKTYVAPQPVIAQPILKSYALPEHDFSYGHHYLH